MITHEEIFALVDDLEKELVQRTNTKSELRYAMAAAKQMLKDNIEVLRGGHDDKR